MDEYRIETRNEILKEYGMEFFPTCIGAYGKGADAHIHDTIEILFIQEGKYNIFVNGERYSAGEGDVLLFRSNAIHTIYSDALSVNRYYVLKLEPSVFFELAAGENAVGYVLRFLGTGNERKVHWQADELQGGAIRRAFDKLIDEYCTEGMCKDISMKICSCQLILSMLRDLMEREEKEGRSMAANDGAAVQIYKAIQYINKNFREEIDEEACAKLVNLSYSYFSRCFKRITGRSFKEYLNEIRVNHAEQLIVTTDFSITQIACECGYSNVSYFISVYKAMKGKTPLQNRQRRSGNTRLLHVKNEGKI